MEGKNHLVFLTLVSHGTEAGLDVHCIITWGAATIRAKLFVGSTFSYKINLLRQASPC